MKIRLLSLIVLVLLAAAPSLALAASPHFVSAQSFIFKSASLDVKLREVGLTGGQTVQYRLSAYATEVWGCVSLLKYQLPATHTRTLAGTTSGTGTAVATRDGVTSRYLRARLLPKPSDLTCDYQWTPYLVSVRYSNIVLTDITNGVVAPPIAAVSRTFHK
jgi:hypothetical protein